MSETTFRLVTPEAPALIYKSRRSLLSRLKKEQDFWAFLAECKIKHEYHLISDVARVLQVDAILEDLEALVENISSSESDELYLQIAEYNDNFGRIPPLSNSMVAQIAKKAYDEGDIETGLNILFGCIFGRERRHDVRRSLHNQTAGAYSTLISIANSAALSRYVVDNKQLNREITSAAMDLKSEAESAAELITEIRNKLTQADESITEQVKHAEKITRRKKRLSEWLHRRAINRNADLQDRFLNQMKYRAPVQLWENRRKQHRKNSDNAFRVFLVGVFIFCVVLILGAIGLGDKIAEAFVPIGCSPETPELCNGISAKGVFYVSISIVFSSIVLWLLRLQMRVYLSERHLSLDAEERKAFAETFLALREDKAVNSEHEAVVLQSLFRPTQDGIIRDNTSVDASPSGLLSKILTQQKNN